MRDYDYKVSLTGFAYDEWLPAETWGDRAVEITSGYADKDMMFRLVKRDTKNENKGKALSIRME